MKLQDKIALVTGASHGIRRAIALDLAKEGENLVINYLKSEKTEKKLFTQSKS